MPLPLLALATALAAEFAPGIIRGLAGKEAGAMAETVVRTAERVTGLPLGAEPDIEPVARALRHDPALLVAFKRDMANLELEGERIAAADRDSARRMQIETRSIMPALLAVLIVALFAAELFLVFRGMMPQDDASKTVVIKGLSLLELAFSLMLGFYYGSSAGSARKDSLLAQAELRR